MEPTNPEASMDTDESGKDDRNPPAEQDNKNTEKKIAKQWKKMDWEKEEEENIVRLFRENHPNSKLA